MRQGIGFATALAIAVCVWPQSSRADDAEQEAESLVQKGIQLRKAGNDAGALPFFERAYRLHPTARTAGQLGFAEQAIGRYADAEKHVTEALEAAKDPWIQKYRTTIDQALAVIKRNVGTLEIVAEPLGAKIRVNGREEGRAPLTRPLRVTHGTVHVEVSAPGHEPTERTFQLHGGGYESVVVRLHPLPESELRGRPEPASGIAAAQPAPSQIRNGDMTQKNWIRMAGWGLFAASGAALAFGTVEYFVYRSKVVEFNDKRDSSNQRRCFDDGTSIWGPNMTPPASDCSTLASGYRSSRRLAIIGSSAGALLLASAVVVTILTSPTRESRMAVECGVQPGSQSIVCAGRF